MNIPTQFKLFFLLTQKTVQNYKKNKTKKIGVLII